MFFSATVDIILYLTPANHFSFLINYTIVAIFQFLAHEYHLLLLITLFKVYNTQLHFVIMTFFKVLFLINNISFSNSLDLSFFILATSLILALFIHYFMMTVNLSIDSLSLAIELYK